MENLASSVNVRSSIMVYDKVIKNLIALFLLIPSLSWADLMYEVANTFYNSFTGMLGLIIFFIIPGILIT